MKANSGTYGICPISTGVRKMPSPNTMPLTSDHCPYPACSGIPHAMPTQYAVIRDVQRFEDSLWVSANLTRHFGEPPASNKFATVSLRVWQQAGARTPPSRVGPPMPKAERSTGQAPPAGDTGLPVTGAPGAKRRPTLGLVIKRATPPRQQEGAIQHHHQIFSIRCLFPSSPQATVTQTGFCRLSGHHHWNESALSEINLVNQLTLRRLQHHFCSPRLVGQGNVFQAAITGFHLNAPPPTRRVRCASPDDVYPAGIALGS